MEQVAQRRYRGLIAIIIYLLLVSLFSSLLMMIVAGIISKHDIYTSKEIINAVSKKSGDSTLDNYGILVSTIGNVSVYVVSAIALGIWLHKDLEEDTHKFSKKIILIILMMALVFASVSQLFDKLVIMIVGSTSENQLGIIDMLKDKRCRIPMAIATMFLAPFVEELVFRKGIFNIFSGKNRWIPIVVSSVVFSLLHMTSTNVEVWKWIVIYITYLVLGFVLSITYSYTNENIYVTILIHVINNVVAVFVILF